ncbi:MAG: hypothetical protein Kow009_01080 [Spirochaetales bacterium]
MVESAHLYTTIPMGDLLRARYGVDRLALPLEQNLFMRFKHVTGVPSPDGQGFSVNKLQLLDTLIEVLKRLQGKEIQLPGSTPPEMAQMDQLIRQISLEVHRKVQQIGQTPYAPALGAGKSAAGLVVDLRT